MTQGSHMSCSYSNIVMVKYDSFGNKFHLGRRVRKRFRNDIFVLRENGIASLPLYSSYINSLNNFTIEITSDAR